MAVEHLSDLCQSLFDHRLSPRDLLHRLRSNDSVNRGLKSFFAILQRGVRPIGDGSDRLGFQLWSDEQIQFVASIGHWIAFSSRSLSVEQAGPLVIAVVQQLLDFAICYLEKSEFSSDDFSVQGWYMTHHIHMILDMDAHYTSKLVESGSLDIAFAEK